MSDWFNDMPQSALPAIKSFFELELLYSYVYILSPSPRVPHIHEYAQRLIFEHCISYASNLLFLLNKPSNTTKPPVTFYDAMRAYMTGRQFVDVLSRNIDFILDPRPAIPPTPSAPQEEPEDPLAPPSQISAPPFPAPLLPEGQTLPMEPATRALNALNDFTSILSSFGLRFGFTHWRDRFQRESAALSSHLQHRINTSPHTSPPVQQIPPPLTYPPQWVPMPSASPNAPHLLYNANLPTTPPSLFPQQPSPFSSSLSCNGNPFEAPQQSPHQASMSYDGSTPQNWATPSPQPMPDMPQPTGGQKRRALVYGAQASGHSPGASSASAQDSTGWLHQHGHHQSIDGTSWNQAQQQQQLPDGNSRSQSRPQHSHNPSDGNNWSQAQPQQQPQLVDNTSWNPNHPPQLQHQNSDQWNQPATQGNWG
jgi:hypothetical protein